MTNNNELFGDYALIIDALFPDTPAIKDAVARADRVNRGGLALIKRTIRETGVTVPANIAWIISICELDQAHHERHR